MTGCTVLLSYPWPSIGSLSYSGKCDLIHDLDILSSIDPEADIKDVGRHHVALAGDHANNGRPWVWQQDSAPCHTSKKNMAFLRANCCDLVPPDMWPPNSPDLNPMDYFTWGVGESRSNAVAYSKKKCLIAAIKRAFSSLERDMVIKATARF